MVEFNYENNFELHDEEKLRVWIEACIHGRGFKIGEINYIFCDDDYLLRLNVEFLDHDTLTDIISFDYSVGKLISGDIYISVERVEENARKFLQSPDNEMNRVIIHGVLHFMGYTDKNKKEQMEMRKQEDFCLALLE
jgi:rRNA maturation RNase YbeY